MDALHPAMLGGAITFMLGVLGCVAPKRVEKLVHISAVGKTGLSEIRATYGGVFLGLGAGILYFNDPKIYVVAAAAWFCAATMRLLSVIFERSRASDNIGAVLFEAAVGTLLIFH